LRLTRPEGRLSAPVPPLINFSLVGWSCPEADLAGGWGSAHWGGKGLFPVSWRVSSGMRPLARVERSGGSADLHFLLGEEDLSAGALLR
jgi:hypothetical protein